ncbi:MAG: ComF family protein [Clostridia bacterium]|nr:ComF family protein [Clostridia bacterium]
MKMFPKLLEKLRERDGQVGYTCDACGKEIFAFPKKRLCAECIGELPLNDKFSCDKCGRKSVTAGVCLDCKRSLPHFTQGVSPFVYGGKVASLVNAMKKGKRRLAEFFGEEAAEAFFEKFQDELKAEGAEDWLLIPVPLTDSVKKKRGYNQAAETCKSVEKRLKELGVSAAMDETVLEKRLETSSQKHLTFVERQENLKGAFHVHKRSVCKGKNILLVDDVMTTGATGSETAALLLGAGAKRVIFLTGASLPERKHVAATAE